MTTDSEPASDRGSALFVFHRHPDLSLPGSYIKLQDLLINNPSYFIYELNEEVKHTSANESVGQEEYIAKGVIEINQSEQYLDEKDLLVEALITTEGILNGEFLEEKYAEIVSLHTIGYIEDNGDDYSNCLAVIRIPENFDQNKLERTADAATSILENAIRLQREMYDTASQFRPE